MKKILKSLYHALPFKEQLFSAIRWLPLPQAIYQHLSFKGEFTVKADDKSFRIHHYGFQLENDLFWKGIRHGWEKTTMQLWVHLCRQSEIVFDIGANTGIFSLIAKTVNPQASVYGFEPIKRIFDKFQYNCSLNNYDIHCEQLAIAAADGKSIIHDFPAEGVYGATLRNDFLPANTIQVEINTIKLDTYIRQNKIHHIDLMKIDVEGLEPEVLKSMGHYLDAFKPLMIIEILTDTIANKVEETVTGKDYRYFYLDNYSTIIPVDHLSARHHLNTNYLLCPSQQLHKLNINF